MTRICFDSLYVHGRQDALDRFRFSYTIKMSIATCASDLKNHSKPDTRILRNKVMCIDGLDVFEFKNELLVYHRLLTTCLAILCRYLSLCDRWLIHVRIKLGVNMNET